MILIGFAAILIDIILLFTGIQPITQSVISFLTIKATPCWCFSLSPLYHIFFDTWNQTETPMVSVVSPGP